MGVMNIRPALSSEWVRRAHFELTAGRVCCALLAVWQSARFTRTDFVERFKDCCAVTATRMPAHGHPGSGCSVCFVIQRKATDNV